MNDELQLEEIARLTKRVVGAQNGRSVVDQKAALDLIRVHIPHLCYVAARREKDLEHLRRENARLRDGLGELKSTVLARAGDDDAANVAARQIDALLERREEG